MRTLKPKLIIVVLAMIFLALPWERAAGQGTEGLRPIDLMVVIDNSCSMFPQNQIISGCTSYGSDPDFLRIKGADLFIARLGFGGEDEGEYQAGVISLGDEPVVVSPLEPLQGARDELAAKIAKPRAQSATKIVPALDAAYTELRDSPNRKPENLPAVVLITDGVPFPIEGQSNSDIEALIADNSDIPLFIMLLQGSEERSESYEQYVRFWQQMQTSYSHVFVYLIDQASQIEETYNKVIAQLQDTIPAEATVVSPEAPLQVFVSEFVQKIVITIVHQSGEPKGEITITDPFGDQVSDEENGVSHFRGDQNPVEVYSIKAPRLDESLKERFWTIASEKPVDLFFDREGSYRINFLNPAGNPTDVNNVYVAAERQNSNTAFNLRFNLIDDNGQAVIKPQTIQGEVIYPDGTQKTLLVSPRLTPDLDGNYEIQLDLEKDYPDIFATSGRIIFVLNVGAADARVTGQIPIASARILVDFEPMPFIQSVEPVKIYCSPDQINQVTVNLGGSASVVPNTLTARLFAEETEISLDQASPGVYQADLTALCRDLVRGLQCSTRKETAFRVVIGAQLPSGLPLQALEEEIPVDVAATACTPVAQTPLPTWTPRPTPPPPPVPDSDGDGLLDTVDACPDQRGWGMLDGCPPPGWIGRVAGVFGVGILAFTALFGGPWLMVRTIAKPPTAYVTACQRGRTVLDLTEIYAVGMERRTNKIKIGSNPRKAHIVIEGLRPVEFVVLEEDDNIVLKDVKSRTVKETFGTIAPRQVSTSHPQITLWIGTNLPNMRKVSCEHR